MIRWVISIGYVITTCIAAAEPIQAQVSNVLNLTTLEIAYQGQTQVVSIFGINEPDQCFAKKSQVWLRSILKPCALIELHRTAGMPDGYFHIAFSSNGKKRDLASTAVRSGAAYANAAIERLSADQAMARAEYRGLWRACEDPLHLFSSVAENSGIAAKIFYGLAMNESQWNGRPWPWTMNVAGTPYYFKDRKAAYKAAQYLISQKFYSFDIGLMQINWRWHRHRFDDAWEALDPQENIRAAAEILVENYSRTNSMAMAVAHYHSRDPVKNQPYLKRFSNHLARISKES